MDSEEFKSIRESAELSQAELAVFLGLSRVFVGLMERGKKPITRRTEEAMRSVGRKPAQVVSTEGDPLLRDFEDALSASEIHFSVVHDIDNDIAFYSTDRPKMRVSISRATAVTSVQDTDFSSDFIAIRGLAAAKLFTRLLKQFGGRIDNFD